MNIWAGLELAGAAWAGRGAGGGAGAEVPGETLSLRYLFTKAFGNQFTLRNRGQQTGHLMSCPAAVERISLVGK